MKYDDSKHEQSHFDINLDVVLDQRYDDSNNEGEEDKQNDLSHLKFGKPYINLTLFRY